VLVSEITMVNKGNQIELQAGMHVHLVGIGGSGLSAIARVLLGKGFIVSGSDIDANEFTQDLQALGANVHLGHRPENCDDADIVLISSAIPVDNPEVTYAQRCGIPVTKRAEFIGAMMADDFGIAVAGTHGKTTTTGMLAQIMIEAGQDPTMIVGGKLPIVGSNGRAGNSEFFLVEADEYDHMFLGLQPKIGVITNIEYDHPDQYPTISQYQEAFRRFANLIPTDGRLIACADDPVAAKVGQECESQIVVETFGLGLANWRAMDLRVNQLGGTDFLVEHDNAIVGLERLRIPGEHNVRNALAATAVGTGLGIEFNIIRRSLAAFGGVGRRFEVIGEVGDVIVIDDYAHHPTEIKATLSAARQQYPGRIIWAVWQPHTYSRTKRLQAEFADSFEDADRVVGLDIFESRETNTLGIDTESVLQEMEHPNANYVGDINEAAVYILDRVKPGDVVLTLTAGDGNKVGEAVLIGIRERIGYNQPPGNHNEQELKDENRPEMAS
jgi:UDP-N-acetylmuramate--alanine ligase